MKVCFLVLESHFCCQNRFSKNFVQIDVILHDFGYAGFQPIEYIMGFCPANNLFIGRLGGQAGSFSFLAFSFPIPPIAPLLSFGHDHNNQLDFYGALASKREP